MFQRENRLFAAVPGFPEYKTRQPEECELIGNRVDEGCFPYPRLSLKENVLWCHGLTLLRMDAGVGKGSTSLTP